MRRSFPVIQPRCSQTGSSWSDLSSVSRQPWLLAGAVCAVMRHLGRPSLHRSGLSSTHRGLPRRRLALASSRFQARLCFHDAAHGVAKHRSITSPPAEHPVPASLAAAPAIPTPLRRGNAVCGSSLRAGVCLIERSRRRPRWRAICASQHRYGSAAARQTHPVGSLGAS